MSSFSDELSDRIMNLIICIMKLEKQLCKTFSGRHLYSQLFRSITSSGANYEESRAGESKADFVHKMQIVLKELRESRFWIKLILTTNILAADAETVKSAYGESTELANMIAKAIVTAKSRLGNN